MHHIRREASCSLRLWITFFPLLWKWCILTFCLKNWYDLISWNPTSTTYSLTRSLIRFILAGKQRHKILPRATQFSNISTNSITNSIVSFGELVWHSGESTRLPPLSLGLKSWRQRPYVGWVCCWFSPLLPEVFLRVLRFSCP